MDIQNIKPNSHKYKEEQANAAATTAIAKPEPRVKKVDISAPVTVRKKSGIKKFAETFFAEDVGNIGQFVVRDVIVPTVKDTIWRSLTNSLEMLLYGEVKGNLRKGANLVRNATDYISYKSFSDSTRDRTYDRRSDNPNSLIGFDPETLVFGSISDAEAVLDAMTDAIETFGFVTINDLYDICGKSSPNYLSANYGWTHFDANTKAVRVPGGGYILKLPKAYIVGK